METIKMRQRLLAFMTDAEGKPYYEGNIDGKWGPASEAAAERFLEDYGFRVEQAVSDSDTTSAIDDNAVLVFSLAADGGTKLSDHFTVREFACNDGSDVVFIHPILPVWAEAARVINGPFKPNSAYRTVEYNAKIGGATYSKHCHGTAMDIPAINATPQELYDLFEEIMGDSGGLGLYSWGVHVDPRPTKSRWKG